MFWSLSLYRQGFRNTGSAFRYLTYSVFWQWKHDIALYALMQAILKKFVKKLFCENSGVFKVSKQNT
jgi:hypothetical protein